MASGNDATDAGEIDFGEIGSPVTRAILEAEHGTTGEIRVQIGKRFLEGDPYQTAVKLFFRYHLHQTTQKNAVLIYVNTRAKKFAFVADEGFHSVVPPGFWDQLGKDFQHNLAKQPVAKAVTEAIAGIGDILRKSFRRED